jgi:hypothetical protein
MPDPNDIPTVPNYKLQTPPLSLRRPRLKLGSDDPLRLGWREVRLKLSREELEKVLSQRGFGPNADMTDALRDVGLTTLTSQPTLGSLADKVGKLRPSWRVGDWNVGVSEEALGRGLLDTLGVKPWTTVDDKPAVDPSNR